MSQLKSLFAAGMLLTAGVAIAEPVAPQLVGFTKPAKPSLENSTHALDKIRAGEGRQFVLEMDGYVPPTNWLPQILGGKARITAQLDADGYVINSRVKAAGIVDWFVDYSSTLSSKGDITEDGLKPREYVASDDEGRKNRRTRIVHHDDSVDVDVVPAHGNLGDPAATMEQKLEAMDPMSALLHLAVNPMATPENPCQGVMRVFDGKGRYNLHLNFGEYVQNYDQKGWRGPAFICYVTYEELAGYKKKTPKELKEQKRDVRWVRIVLADLGEDEIRVPVAIEARSRKRGKISVIARSLSYGPLAEDHAMSTTGADA